ncbi:deoxyhypusine synthase [Malassezia sp. CBS 17886]|nr:deoxyhypusine synthase [Malassezia sp. CBS 17886]
MAAQEPDAPPAAQSAVLMRSEPVPEGTRHVNGPSFDTLNPNDLHAVLSSMETIGFQGSSVHEAIRIIEHMRTWRLSDDPAYCAGEDGSTQLPADDPGHASNVRCTILLGYTSNLISSGLREVIHFLVKHKYVSAIVTTAGGVEEDLIKCLGSTYLGAFHLDGASLRQQGLNRIGNLIVPNDNYCKFEDWVMPILDAMRAEQDTAPNEADGERFAWTPSRVIERLGHEINDERSVYYWAAKNKIPVFCPALTDGSLGDMIYFHSYKNPGLVIDIVRDIRRLNDISVKAKKAGVIILGGGVCKHQIANAMLFVRAHGDALTRQRNGADYAVYINTGQEFDGSDSGARPDEAVSWGKLKSRANGGESVKVYCDATIIFPLIVAATFVRGAFMLTPEVFLGSDQIDAVTRFFGQTAGGLPRAGTEPSWGHRASKHTNNWAVLVCTSRFWFNYRHMANVLGMYRTVKRLGVPDSHIILMLADDVACNSRNPNPGAVWPASSKELDLYGDDVEVDYRGYEVTVLSFLQLLTGRVPAHTPLSKRLNTDERSNVFLYMTGHGGDEFLKFQDAHEINAVDIADAIEQMWEKRRYHELLFMADTCQAMTLAQHIYSPNVLAVGSSLKGQNSYSYHVDKDLGVPLIDRYTHSVLDFMEHVDRASNRTLQDLFGSLDARFIHSDPGIRADMYHRNLSDVPVTDFFGSVAQVELT